MPSSMCLSHLTTNSRNIFLYSQYIHYHLRGTDCSVSHSITPDHHFWEVLWMITIKFLIPHHLWHILLTYAYPPISTVAIITSTSVRSFDVETTSILSITQIDTQCAFVNIYKIYHIPIFWHILANILAMLGKYFKHATPLPMLHIPEHATPSPVKPGRQAQRNAPWVLVHVALLWQLSKLSWHSLMSRKRERKR